MPRSLPTPLLWGLPVLLLVTAPWAVPLDAQGSTRARDLGIVLDGTPGSLKAITDVPGLEVGQVTLIEGDGLRVQGQGPIRTGVTAVLPRGRHDLEPVFAEWFNLNGNAEMTGTARIDDSGFMTGPFIPTNTLNTPGLSTVAPGRGSTISARDRPGSRHAVCPACSRSPPCQPVQRAQGHCHSPSLKNSRICCDDWYPCTDLISRARSRGHDL